MKFRVLAGRHIQNGRTYLPGEVVESDTDLVAKMGSQKFQRVGAPQNLAQDRVQQSSAAPGGQVSSGHQMTTSLPDGTQVSGPEDLLTEDPQAQARKIQSQEQQPVLPVSDSVKSASQLPNRETVKDTTVKETPRHTTHEAPKPTTHGKGQHGR